MFINYNRDLLRVFLKLFLNGRMKGVVRDKVMMGKFKVCYW